MNVLQRWSIRTQAFYLVAIVLVLLLAACGGTGANQQVNKPAHRITYIPINTGNPYFDAVYAGMRKSAQALGVQLNEVAPSSASATGQLSFVQDQMSRHVDGLIVSPADPAALVPTTKRATGSGTKIITVNSDFDDPTGRLASVLPVDFTEGGVEMVQMLAAQINHKGDIAILTANPTAPAQTVIIDGMKQELSKPEYKDMHLVKVAFGYDDPGKSFTQTQNLLTSFPHLAGILAPTTVAVAAAAQALEEAGKAKQVALLGLGLPSQMRKYIKDGTTPQVLLWDPSIEGGVSLYLLEGLVNGTIKPQPGGTFAAGPYGTKTFGKDNVVIAGGYQVFDANNVDQFQF